MGLGHLNPYELGLDKNPANYVPLTPLTFLERAALVHPQRLAVVHGAQHYTWEQSYRRCRQLASALSQRSIGVGDTVAVMLSNTPEMFEVHFGVPMSGATLNTLNVRLDAEALAFMLQHANTKVLITDREFSSVIERALRMIPRKPLVIDVLDPEYHGEGQALGTLDYEAFLAGGDPEFAWQGPTDEWAAIALNYTSGTTGNPKGVVYHHRGAYLNALGNLVAWDMGRHPVYLWTLPMYHCNGWCFPWSLAAAVGTSVCLRAVRVEPIIHLLRQQQVTHFCAAPIVLSWLINTFEQQALSVAAGIRVMTAGSAPPAAIIEGMERLGFEVTHVYGLTETYGPSVVCDWHEEWDTLPLEQRAQLKARQGVRHPLQESLMVADPLSLEPVPKDGKTLGEVLMRGNLLMKGYLKNPAATEEAFSGGWFHSGDIAVWHADGYIEIKDRSKDIIISGGENISTIEVEDVLYRHPAIMEAAVVARPDHTWGETPCAFVTLKHGMQCSEEELIEFCRGQIAHFKAPRTVIFGPLPKTSTGKIQKFMLRQKARQL